MAISSKTVAKCLDWDDCDIRTMLYIISLDDACDEKMWETELITSIILKAAEEMVKNQSDKDELPLDLHAALERIHLANNVIEMREMREEAERNARAAKI